MNILAEAKRVFDAEIFALNQVKSSLDERFIYIVDIITKCEGKVIITGMGKPGHIGNKIAATLASLGTPSFYLHPAEALHGDLGMITKKDVVIAISYSGESEEITRILPIIKLIGAQLIAISGNDNSTLVKYSDYSYIFPTFREACSMNLAPTSSTTATLVLGDALAVTASMIYGFNEKNYAIFHPAGSLGKKLLIKVSDLMHKNEKNAVILKGSTLKQAIVELSSKALSMVSIVDTRGKLLGVLTDGDLRRLLEREENIYGSCVDNLMTKNPYTVKTDTLAVEALKLLYSRNITALPVLDDSDTVVGTIRIHDISCTGIII